MSQGDRYSILIVPEGTQDRVRRFEVSGHVLKGAMALGLLLAAALVAGVAGVTVGLKASARSSELRAENAEYQRQLSRAEGMAENLASQLEALKETESRLKQLYNYEGRSADSKTGEVAPGDAPTSPSPGSPANLAVGGKGGIEGGRADRMSPGFDLYLGDVAQSSIPLIPFEAPPQSTDPLLISLTALGADIDAVRNRMSSLEQHLIERTEALRHIPSIKPVKSGWISSVYGVRVSPFTGVETFHDGLDIVANIGDPVLATADGVVTFASYANGMGLMVEIDHGQGIRTRYGHNQRALVRVGRKVKRGQKIARVGMTGNTTGPHVHYEVLKDGRNVNPRDYLADE